MNANMNDAPEDTGPGTLHGLFLFYHGLLMEEETKEQAILDKIAILQEKVKDLRGNAP